jgi:hypothetical protein
LREVKVVILIEIYDTLTSSLFLAIAVLEENHHGFLIVEHDRCSTRMPSIWWSAWPRLDGVLQGGDHSILLARAGS